MWGGVKARRQYGEAFRQWNAAKGLESVRKALAYEPRPWFLAFGLHQHNHLLQDHHCARLLSWCATLVQLCRTPAEKQESYRFSQEAFNLLNRCHRTGNETFLEYMRLCAIGKDLTSAFAWYEHWIEAKKEGHDSILHLVWLLRLASLSPNDESVEDMVVAVLEAYRTRFCVPVAMARGESGEKQVPHMETCDDVERDQLRCLFCAFKATQSRVRDANLLEFLDGLSVSTQEAEAWVDSGWPSKSHHHVFPHLEGGQKVPTVTIQAPRLRDSILHPLLIQELEEAAFAHRTQRVLALLKQFQECVRAEKDSHRKPSLLRSDVMSNRWHQIVDLSAQQFREAVVQGGGLTPEMYHYVVVSLAAVQPSAALRTLGRMQQSNLRVLDLTRAVVLVATEGSFDTQLKLFREQLEEIETRRKLDDDFEIVKQIEHYWKYEYTDFFHYANALDHKAFYALLMQGIGKEGPKAVQSLLLAAQVHGPAVLEEDLVILDDALRDAAVSHFRSQIGSESVNAVLDVIASTMPKLDIALMGSIPHFSDYFLSEHDSIATSIASLKDRLLSEPALNCIYVLDASFVETSEGFLSLGRSNKVQHADSSAQEHSLILVPYVTLMQLSASIAGSKEVVSFDTALQESIRAEPFLASQRLRSLFALLQHPSSAEYGSGGAYSRCGRVLHFTECLLAQGIVDAKRASELGLDPRISDNDHLLLVLSMLRALVPPRVRVVLCTDDEAFVTAIQERLPQLFAQPIEVLSTELPEAVVDVEKGLIDDTPFIKLDADAFVPKLGGLKPPPALPRLLNSHQPQSEDPMREMAIPDEGTLQSKLRVPPADTDTIGALDSPWLAMLCDSDAAANKEKGAVRSGAVPEVDSVISGDASSPALVHTALDKEKEESETRARKRYDALLDVYDSSHAVVSAGAAMQEADAMDSIFEQFNVMEPDAQAILQEENVARLTRLATMPNVARKKPRRRSALEKEMLANQGASNKERFRLARQLSNAVGGRVPFNFRYRIFTADVNDPRNASLRKSYEEAIKKKRESFKKMGH